MSILAIAIALCVQPADTDYAYCDTGISIGRLYGRQTLAPAGQYMYSCDLDRFGRFLPNGLLFLNDAEVLARYKKSEGIRDAFYFRLPLNNKVTDYYEFSSYRLIRGHKDKDPLLGKDRFIPAIGSKIIPFDQYLVSDELSFEGVWFNPSEPSSLKRPSSKAKAIHVYNLPGRIVPALSDLKKTTLSSFPVQPPPFKTAGKQNVEQTHQFHPSRNHRLAVRFGNYIYLGTMDIDSGEINFDDTTKRQLATEANRFNLPPWLMQPKHENESVYELRSGSLVPGFLHKLGNEEWLFVPDIGGTVIDASEYLKTYQPWSRRIYNLPGEFRQK